VKQLICDNADITANDQNDVTPIDVAATEDCRAALEEASALREKHAEFARLVDAGSWDDAMSLIYSGLPANVMLPCRDHDISEREYAIHKAARQGNMDAYTRLVYAGANPLLPTGSDSLQGLLPSGTCDDTEAGRGIKPLIEEIEKLCKEKPGCWGIPDDEWVDAYHGDGPPK